MSNVIKESIGIYFVPILFQDGVAVGRVVVFLVYIVCFRFVFVFFFLHISLKLFAEPQLLLNTLLQPASPNVAFFPKVFIFTSDLEPLN